MFKSIFSKYVAAVSVIIVISFLILATVLAAVIGDYGQTAREEEVAHIADITERIAMYAYPEDGSRPTLRAHLTARPDFGVAVDSVCTEDSAVSLFIVGDGGELLYASRGFTDRASAVIADKVYLARIETLLDAGVPYDRMESVAALGGESCLVHVTPCLDGESNRLGYVYSVTSTESVAQITKATMQTILMACLWVMLAILVAVYFITERHVDPIRRMSVAAHEYAKGDFSARVEAVGGDEIAELAGAINYMATELESLEQKRNRFISDVSHELRSPMTSMLGFVEAVADGSCPPEKREYYLSLVAEEIKRLSRLVADLLDVSRLEMGEQKMNFVKYDIADNAATVLISLEQRINDKHLDVSFAADTDKIFVRADADAMYRVLYNLIENAVKFSREEGRLSLSLAAVDGCVRVEIYNEGIGISPEDLPNVFDRFYKSDKSRGVDKKGVGLGLYFVKTIVTAHGGDVRAESRAGEDCRFVLTLPLYHD